MTNLKADDIADFILGFANETGDLVTNLKLQKLLYYAQAWYLANKKEALFQEDFEAWVHGPVIPRIYNKYKEFGSNPIPNKTDLAETQSKINPEIIEYLNEVLTVYMPYSAFELELMTHKEEPWLDARGDIPLSESSTSVIEKDAMTNYYAERLQKK